MKIAGTLKKQDTDDQETSTCYMCSHNCEIHVSTRVAKGSNEKMVTEIALPDCVRGSAMVEHRESDVRLLNPEMRNENGEWVKSTWQKSIDTIAENLKKIVTISDRRQAIKTACKFSETGDILLIAGKGHENYQEIRGERLHFDDLVEVKKYFNLLKK